jgi:acyl-CoA reductase-like NAD-dependent aldehyde dehydrogenase
LLEDVDIETATARIFRSAFACSGQICKAIKRVYVPSRLYEPVLESFSDLARNHRIGDGLEPGVKMGPLQNKMQYEKVIDLIEDARRQPGARIVWGGDKLDRPGYFISPTIIAGLNDQARLVSEEQFGPVLPVLKYDSIDDAIRRANDSRMALGASIWTKDIDMAEKLANRIEAGTIWINSHGGSAPNVPFGGLKESGLGHERGQLGFRCYMQARIIDVPVQ